MAKYGSDQVTIEIRDGVNGAGDWREIGHDVEDFNGINIQAELEETHGFGQAWVEHTFAGLKRADDITLNCWYDDKAAADGGTHELLNREGETTELRVGWGGGKTTTVGVVIRSYNREPGRGELTKANATLAVTGAPVEA